MTYFGSHRHPRFLAWFCVVSAGCLLASGCGSSSGTAPTTPSETPISIQAGTYALRITSGAILPGPQVAVCLSVGVPVESLPTTLAVRVSVEASGTLIVGRDADDTLVLSLRQNVNDASGTIRGYALAQDGRSTLTAGGDAQLSGRVTSATSLSGNTGGGLTFSQDTASYSCSTNRWTLSRQ